MKIEIKMDNVCIGSFSGSHPHSKRIMGDISTITDIEAWQSSEKRNLLRTFVQELLANSNGTYSTSEGYQVENADTMECTFKPNSKGDIETMIIAFKKVNKAEAA